MAALAALSCRAVPSRPMLQRAGCCTAPYPGAVPRECHKTKCFVHRACGGRPVQGGSAPTKRLVLCTRGGVVRHRTVSRPKGGGGRPPRKARPPPRFRRPRPAVVPRPALKRGARKARPRRASRRARFQSAPKRRTARRCPPRPSTAPGPALVRGASPLWAALLLVVAAQAARRLAAAALGAVGARSVPCGDLPPASPPRPCSRPKGGGELRGLRAALTATRRRHSLREASPSPL